MSTQINLSRTDATDSPAPPPRVRLPPEPQTVSAPKKTPGGGRRREGAPVSSLSLKSFSLFIGGTIGIAAGLLSRHFLGWVGLDQALSPLTLGFMGVGWGLAVAYLLSRLMLLARERTIRVSLDGKTREFPLRRRHEVVARACQYLAGLTFGFLLALVGSWYTLAASVPQLSTLNLNWGRDLQASLIALVASLACLALGEWVFRLTRKEGRTEHSPFLMIPSLLALGASLAGAV